MLKKGLVKGMDIIGGKKLPSPCKPCLKGKQTHAEIQKATDTCTGTVLEWISLDVCRKLSTKSHQGYEYFMTWIDDKSRKMFVMGMCNKLEALHWEGFPELPRGAWNHPQDNNTRYPPTQQCSQAYEPDTLK